MSHSANVRSLEAIREFKVRAGLFGEEVSQTLAALQQELNRVLDWVENDRPRFWRQQVQKSYDRVGEARVRLAACRRRKVGDHRPSCIEEQQDLERAKRQLRMAQEKVEIVRRWSEKLRHELEEYKGSTAPLVRCVTGDIPRSAALLDRILDSLDSYVSVPSGDRARPAGEPPGADHPLAADDPPGADHPREEESADGPPKNDQTGKQT